MATDQWLQDLEAAQQTASDTQQLIQARPAACLAACCRCSSGRRASPLCTPPALQERNLKFPEGGPEASRLTATARRKLGTLGGLLDGLRAAIEAPGQGGL